MAPPLSPRLDQELAAACVALGLAPPFSADEAKSRYRELAKLYHPDVGVARNQTRFAEISRAYDLVEENISRFSSTKLSLAADTAAESRQLADVLRQLHEARSHNVKMEQKLSQLTEESHLLRSYVKGTRGDSKKRVIAVVLLIIVGLVLGFLAGMMWSMPPTRLPLIMPPAAQVEAPVDALPVTISTSGVPDHQYTFSAIVDMAVTYPTSGTVELKAGGASMHSSPTVTISGLRDIRIFDTAPTGPAAHPPPTTSSARASLITATAPAAPAPPAPLAP